MRTFYVLNKKLKPWNRDLLNEPNIKSVKVGDPLTVEYKRIHIMSNNFDYFGKSEVMVVNHIRNKQTKERSLESITYYDDDSETKGSLFGKQSWSVGPFDPSEYGNPVCFHTPGYQGTTILITTKMWEINDPTIIKSGITFAQSLLGIAKSASPFLEIVDTSLGITSKVISGYIGHKELSSEHTLELRLDSDYPLLPGKYVCVPNLFDINERKRMVKDFFLEDNHLVKLDEKGNLVEYEETYFIIKVSNYERLDLNDFDFTASSADLLEMVQKTNDINKLQQELININRDSYNLNLMEQIKQKYDDWVVKGDNKYIQETVALYKQLGTSGIKNWFDENFPFIADSVMENITNDDK